MTSHSLYRHDKNRRNRWTVATKSDGSDFVRVHKIYGFESIDDAVAAAASHLDIDIDLFVVEHTNGFDYATAIQS